MGGPGAVAIVIIGIYLLSSIKILREYERGVIFRLGRLLETAKGPGVILVFWPIDTIVRVSLRQEAFEVPPQDVITRDNVTLKVNAVIFLRVIDPRHAVVEVSNYQYQTSQFAQTTLRSVLGEVELDELLAHREKLNARIQSILDTHTAPWGVKVVNVEVLAEAAHIISTEPATLQLRYLQTLTEIGVEKNTTIVFPLPVDIISGLTKLLNKGGDKP
jgi:regulator of protease activity HflC (stomatin/prohibitin superfamily)